MRKRTYPALYASWTVLCAVLFLTLAGAEDPSRRHDRILSNDAGRMAQQILQKNGAYRGYDVVHVAYASHAEGQAEARWIVLLDAEPHTAMRRAVVVELRASDGALVRVRKPVS